MPIEKCSFEVDFFRWIISEFVEGFLADFKGTVNLPSFWMTMRRFQFSSW